MLTETSKKLISDAFKNLDNNLIAKLFFYENLTRNIRHKKKIADPIPNLLKLSEIILTKNIKLLPGNKNLQTSDSDFNDCNKFLIFFTKKT